MDAQSNSHAIRSQAGTLGFERLAQLLGGWQRTELRAVRGFPECRGLSDAQLEDLYQDTALALLSRHYASEQHLRNALRTGIRHRALNVHRDERRRREILEEHAPALHDAAEAAHARPDELLLAQQDRLIAKEFLAELDALERDVFALSAEGLRYRAIATALAITPNAARSAVRRIERKRARFQLLYETGRLCGYRAATIQALASGNASELVERQALAHLAGCPACRAGQARRSGTLALSGLATVLAAAVAAAWRWARRRVTVGVAAKASAIALTAAVVAGSALNAPSTSRRHEPPGRSPRAGRTRGGSDHTRSTPNARPRVALPTRPDRTSAPSSRNEAHPAPAAPSRTSLTVPRATTAGEPTRTEPVEAAEREFGPER